MEKTSFPLAFDGTVKANELGYVMATPDMIPHSVGYYLQPPVWIGDSAPEIVPDLNVEKLSEVVCERTVQGTLKCKAFREGLFIFDFAECLDRYTGPFGREKDFDVKARCRAQQSAVLNCHLMCLYTSLCSPGRIRLMERMIVEPSDLVLGCSSDGLGSYRSLRTAYLAVARFPLTYNPTLPKHVDWRNISRMGHVIKPAEVERSFSIFDDVLGRSNANRLISLADLLARAVKALSELSFEVSLGLSWMVCEACLDQMWERYLEDRATQKIDGVEKKVINSKRREKLTGRDYSASIISEILSLAGNLSFSDYEELGLVRVARNNWIHDLKAVDRDIANKALLLAQRMFDQVEGVYFTVFPHSSL